MKYILRYLSRHKSNTIINILGLSLGVTCALVLFLMIQYATGFDRHHTKGDQVYRVVTESLMNGREDNTPGVAEPFVNAFRSEFHQVSIVAPVNYRVGGRVHVLDSRGEVSNTFEEHEGVVFLDDKFYQMLDRQWIQGDPKTSLQEPNHVVLSKSIAEKYFGSVDVINEALTIDGVGNLQISGVVEDIDKNKTDFPFEILISYKTYESLSTNLENWGSISSDFQCYALISDPNDVPVIESQLLAFADKYYGEDRKDQKTFLLQPLKDLHMNESYSNYSYQTVSKSNIWGMAILGILLIITACINFINLSTAMASQRFKAVAIRKVLGSGRSHIIWSFFGESAIITLVAILLAIGLTELALIKVNVFMDTELALVYTDFSLFIFLIGTWISVSIISGFYPAYVLSKFQPSRTLKGAQQTGKGVGFFLRKTLVVFQFAVSQVLIIGTIITTSQLDFFKEMAVGFKKEGILTIEIPDHIGDRKSAFKNGLAQLSESEAVSLSYRPPASTSTSVTNIYYQFGGERQELDVQIIPADESFIDVYKIEVLHGEGLVPSDTFNRLVINEAFAHEMGFTDPALAVGEMIDFWGRETPISGVSKDFHTFSLHEEVRPVMLFTNISSYETASIGFQAEDLPSFIEKVEEVFASNYPGYEFNYDFMDERFAGFYEGEQKMSDLLTVFAGIAIFIGCLGLFGLVSYLANRRSKEIGIRKILGASVPSVVFGFSKEFGILVVVAFGIAAPLSYYGMSLWLQTYVYKIDLSFGMFLSGILLSLGIAMLTIAYKSIEASLKNPADVLRDE